MLPAQRSNLHPADGSIRLQLTHHKRPADKPSAGRFLLYPQLPVGAGLCSPAESAVFTEIPGEIVQQGTHDDLINADGLYRRFVVERRQAAGWKV